MKGFRHNTGDIAIYLTPTEMIELAHRLLGLHLGSDDGGWLEFSNDEKEKAAQHSKVKCQILFYPLREQVAAVVPIRKRKNDDYSSDLPPAA